MAASTGNNIKEAIIGTLNQILSHDSVIRNEGEHHMQMLEVTEEYGVLLLEIALDNGNLPIRQLSAVLLQQYIEAHWCRNGNKFQHPECPAPSKAKIRQMLPLGLFMSSSKVRSCIAYAVSSIASWDWPEQWPDLFDIIIKTIQSGDESGVHGAMRVLTEFSRDLDDFHIQTVAPAMLPEMYNIICQDEKYSIRTRGRAVEIFSSVATVICMMGEYNKGLAKTLLYPSLPPFITALLKYLQMSDGLITDSGLKKEILKALVVLVTNVPRQMTEYLPDILSYVWNTLTSSAEIYHKTTINATEENSYPTDSDGEILGFESLVFTLFEFVTALLKTTKHKDMIRQGVPDLMYYLILYMQLTEEQIEIFSESTDSFVEFEDEESFTFSVRSSAQDLLKSLRCDLPDLFCSGLTSAVQKHIQNAESMKNSGENSWWKPVESVLMAVGLSADSLLEQKENQVSFDVKNFIDVVIRPNLDSNLPSFLVGRALWCSAELSKALDISSLETLLQMSTRALQPDAPPIIKVSTIRSLPGFLSVFDLQETEDRNKNEQCNRPLDILKPYFPSIVEGLVYSTAQSSPEVMALALDTLNIVVSLDHSLTTPHINKVSSLCLAIFIKSCNDPLLVSLVQDILQELCTHPDAVGLLQDKFLPTLTSLLNAPPDKVSAGIHPVSLDMLSVLVRACPPSSSDSQLMQTVFPAVINRTMNTEDLTTQQNGGECLRAFVSTAPDKVIEWRDNDGRTGLDYIVSVCYQFLAPGESDSSAAFIGRLVTALIKKASTHLGDNLHQLLRRVLSKLQSSTAINVIMNLIVVFAHLVHTELNDLLKFLSVVPGPEGGSALDFVLSLWCMKQHLFYGNYERKVTVLALAKLLEHGIINDDSRLQNITVQGDQIISSTSGVRTRSKSQVEQWTRVPLLAKLFKLIIYELANILEANASRDDGQEGDEDEGWEDEDYSDAVHDGVPDELDDGAIYASDLLSDDFSGDLVDEADDPDALTDPVNSIQLHPYLTNFIKTFSRHPAYTACIGHLNPHEKQTLAAINVPFT